MPSPPQSPHELRSPSPVPSVVNHRESSISSLATMNFRRILDRFPNGIPASLFADEYYKEFGVQFDSTIWGYRTPMELFIGLPSVFAIQPPTPENNKFFAGYGFDSFLHDSRHKRFDKVRVVEHHMSGNKH